MAAPSKNEIIAALDPWRRAYGIAIKPFEAKLTGEEGVGPRLPTAWPSVADLRKLADLFDALGGRL